MRYSHTNIPYPCNSPEYRAAYEKLRNDRARDDPDYAAKRKAKQHRGYELRKERLAKIAATCRSCGSTDSFLRETERGFIQKRCGSCGGMFPQTKTELMARSRENRKALLATPEGREKAAADRRVNNWALGLINQCRQKCSKARRGKTRGFVGRVEIGVQWVREQFARQQGRCFYTGIPFEIVATMRGIRRPSLDRKDSSLGYTPENTVLCLTAVNYMKSDYALEDFMALLEAIRDA